MSEKMKLVVVTMGKRLETLERINKGESVNKICNELNTGKSTVNDCHHNRKVIEDFCTQIDSE